MFLGKNTKNPRSLFTVFALAMIVILSGASIADAQTPTTRLNDFVGDNRTDWTTLQFTTGGPIRWKTLQNPAPTAPGAAFRRDFDYGLADTDNVTVGDYVGDSKSDPTVWRETTPGTFYVALFPTGTGGITLNRAVQFGNGATDVPGAQGDYDGDGKTDYTLVRVVGGNLVWYILGSVNNTARAVTFGTVTGQTGPAVFPGADFNGDGRDELVYLTRNAAGTIVNYFIGDALTGAGVITRSFGNYNTDFSVAPDDYTGDGRADFVAVRETQGANAVWYIGNSQNTTVTATTFGLADPAFMDLDVPVRGDFDGDGRHDICVWRESNQTFYFVSSLFPGQIGGQRFGDVGDTPLGSFGLY
jgi:hypothetical protein